MFTKEQEAYLADLADRGIAEQKEIEDRNAQVAIDMAAEEARQAKLAKLKAAADKLIADGMQEFEATI